MIPLTDASWQTLSWQELVAGAISDISELISVLGLPPQDHYSDFPIKVPAPYLHRIKKNDASDPLLLQILSKPEEAFSLPGYTPQPLQEDKYSPMPGLIQKYAGRVLIIVSGACAINCRYCFRRHFPYQGFQPDTDQWQKLLDHIRCDTSIKEVIFSGGDPLMLPDRRLTQIVQQLEQIPHVTTLRIHTRLPVVIPQRVCQEMLDWINPSRLKIVLVTHINHENEIDQQVINAMQILSEQRVTLLNQSVLLRDINDSISALSNLSEKLFQAGILPYYLHLMDQVSGAAHFDVKKDSALILIQALRDQLPGYLVPKLVQEIPGTAAKQLVG